MKDFEFKEACKRADNAVKTIAKFSVTAQEAVKAMIEFCKNVGISITKK